MTPIALLPAKGTTVRSGDSTWPDDNARIAASTTSTQSAIGIKDSIAAVPNTFIANFSCPKTKPIVEHIAGKTAILPAL